MGGSTTTQDTQQQQTTQLPPWINDAAQHNYAFAQNVAMQPLQQYQGQMVPDIGPQMQQAWDTSATAGNAGIPQFNAATAGYAGALGQTPMSITPAQLSGQNLSAYMNPYTQSVIDATLPIYQQQLGLNQDAQQNAAASSNAYGGSRQGIQQGVTQAQGAQGMAQMAAQLNQANYTQAVQGAEFDVGAQNTAFAQNQAAQQAKINSDILAASGLASTGTNLAQQANNAFNMQNTAGSEQMQYAQSQINADQQKFTQAFNYPQTQMGILQSALGMTPYGTSTTGTGQTQTTTPFDWGSLATAGIGALGSVFAGKGPTSDRRLKKNLQKVGEHKPTKTPIYAYNWKGEPPGAPKSLGPMAQDLQKTIPGSVAKHPTTGVLHVHPAVLGALARPAPAGTIGAMAAGQPVWRKHEQRRRMKAPQIHGALSG
jgi:hypothetical protein